MRLEYYPLEKLKREILEIMGRHLDFTRYQVFFFGSRVEGKGTDRSDIDIGIKGSTPVPSKILAAIEEEVENISTLYKIEIVDFQSVSEKFRKVAYQHMEVIK
ncbi:MAG: nucleotidyltransferase family protein [Nitrospirota bacterium]